MSTAPCLTSTAPVIAPPPTRAFWQIVRFATRLSTLPSASIAGPSHPIMTAALVGPTPISSTCFSSRSCSWYSPGITRIVSNGFARAIAAPIVAKAPWVFGSTTSALVEPFDGDPGFAAAIILSANRRSFCVWSETWRDTPSADRAEGVADPLQWHSMSCRQSRDHRSRRAYSCFHDDGSRSAFARRLLRNAPRQICSSTSSRNCLEHCSRRQSSRGPKPCWRMVRRTSCGRCESVTPEDAMRMRAMILYFAIGARCARLMTAQKGSAPT